jgi:hypothetical protein
MPDPEAFGQMSAYNEELAQAGVLLALDGLHPGGSAAHVTVKDGRKTITDGPFAEAKEVVGGYWVIQAKTRAEAVEWASRVPIGEGRGSSCGRSSRSATSRRRSRTQRASPRCRRGRPSSRSDGDGAHGRRHLADRVGPADRRSDPDHARRRRRRGPRPGRAGRGAGDVADVRRSGEPGRLVDGHGEEPRDRPAAAHEARRVAPGGARARLRRAHGDGGRPSTRPHCAGRSRTTSSASSSCAAIPFRRPRRESR